MNIVNQLHPKRFQYRQDGEYARMNLPRGERHGLLAQDVEKVLPGLVIETPFDAATIDPNAAPVPTNLKALNYTELIPIMIKAIQEQQAENQRA